MKGLLILTLALLVFLHAVIAQDCQRIKTYDIKVKVNWCPQPAEASLKDRNISIGYCINAKCRSSHKPWPLITPVKGGMNL